MSEKYTVKKIKEEIEELLNKKEDWEPPPSGGESNAQVRAARVQALHALADILLREEKPAGDPPKGRVATTGPTVITADN